jgi:hypothetical protein
MECSNNAPTRKDASSRRKNLTHKIPGRSPTRNIMEKVRAILRRKNVINISFMEGQTGY